LYGYYNRSTLKDDYKKNKMGASQTVKVGLFAYKKNQMSTDRESGRGNKRARVTRGSRNPKHDKRKAQHCAQTKQIKLRKLQGHAENATRGGDKGLLTRR
jgi:hypothetical protein